MLYFSKVSVYISLMEICSGLVSLVIVFKNDASGIFKIDFTSEFGFSGEIFSNIATNGVILYLELSAVSYTHLRAHET